MAMNDRASVTTRTATRLHRFAIHLLRRVRAADAQTGLSAARLSALSVLVFGGERTIGELATAEQVSPPTMTRLAAALEADGLIQRRPSMSDGRVVRLRATARGRRVLEAGRDRRVALVERLLDRLSPGDLSRVESVLDLLEGLLTNE
jgi:DNA-binding MarR family transcriptional regulator